MSTAPTKDTTMNTPFFMTHHPVPGLWSSLTFGLPGRGISIDHENDLPNPAHDLWVALVRGEGEGDVLPFLEGRGGDTADFVDMEEKKRLESRDPAQRWQVVEAGELRRNLTAGTDSYESKTLSLRIHTSLAPFPENPLAPEAALALMPALLGEVEFDNSSNPQAAQGLLAIRYQGQGRIRPLDWSSDGKLCGVAFGGQWALAALPEPDRVGTLQKNGTAIMAEKGKFIIHPNGNEGGVLVHLGPGEKRCLRFTFAFHHAGSATWGIETEYAAMRHFKSLESTCLFALENHEDILARRRAAQCPYDKHDQYDFPKAPQVRKEVFYQSLLGYLANTQMLVEGEKRIRFNVQEGKFLWRNTVDLAVDHLFWELDTNPWVVRNLCEQIRDDYSWEDEVRFPEAPEIRYPGGVGVAHDMGNGVGYSPRGRSGYEIPGNYGFMTMEQVLNAALLASGWGITSGQDSASEAMLNWGERLLDSMQRRDHWSAERRDGILKGETWRTGHGDHEITTYDCLDPALKRAAGGVNIVFKTFAASLCLEAWFEKTGRIQEKGQARDFADRASRALEKAFDKPNGLFPANLLESGPRAPVAVIAAIEPLAWPAYLGLEKSLSRYGKLMELTRLHALTCLQPGMCLEPKTRGLRLSGASPITFPSKVFMVLYVLEKVLSIPHREVAPGMDAEIFRWCQVSCAESTIADQILTHTGVALNGFNYPRLVTSRILL